MFFVFSSCLNGSCYTKIGSVAVKYKGAKLNIGKGLSGQSYAIPFRKQKHELFNQRRLEFEINDFLDYSAKNPQMQFQVTNLIAEQLPLRKENIIPLFSDKPDNCHISGLWSRYVGHGENRVLIYVDEDIKSQLDWKIVYPKINHLIRKLENVKIIHNDTLFVKHYAKNNKYSDIIIPKDHASFSSNHLTNIFNLRDLLWYSTHMILITKDKNKLLNNQIVDMANRRNIILRIIDY